MLLAARNAITANISLKRRHLTHRASLPLAVLRVRLASLRALRGARHALYLYVSALLHSLPLTKQLHYRAIRLMLLPLCLLGGGVYLAIDQPSTFCCHLRAQINVTANARETA